MRGHPTGPTTRDQADLHGNKHSMIARFIAACICFAVFGSAGVSLTVLRISQSLEAATPPSQSASDDRDVAMRFAPLFYQALGDKPRSDFLTNFDFDGDWRGDNNWVNTDDPKYPLKAYVYYSVAETITHYFIHYAVFHPRDYKAGERGGTILSELIREGMKRGGKYDPTGLGEEAALAHENDMEGCLVVVQKDGPDLERARVVFVETLHHNNFSRYVAGEEPSNLFERISLQDQHPLIYIEPKGHGIESFTSDKQVGGKQFLLYKFSGKADDPAADKENRFICKIRTTDTCEPVNYDLLPISTTLWVKARNAPNATYGKACDYGELSIIVQSTGRPAENKVKVGEVGCAFLGRVGGHDMARPPWAWFDKDERDRTLGLWFFDPASTVKLDFQLNDEFSTTYLRSPFWTN